MLYKMLQRARSLVQCYRAQQLDSSALYWADKAFSLSGGALDDLVSLVQCLHVSKQYKRALHILEANSLLQHSRTLRYLAARCFAACEEWQEVLDILSTQKDQSPLGQKRFSEEESGKSYEVATLGNLDSASLVLQATAHEGLGDLNSAVDCYRQALANDVYCVEALDKLCKYHSLSYGEEKNLYLSLPFSKQCSGVEEQSLKAIYQRKLNHYRSNLAQNEVQLPANIQALESNTDLMCDVASMYLDSMNIDACYRQTSSILEIDPYHQDAILLHIVCCVSKSKSEVLFSIGHRLVNSLPSSTLAWYTVSCYYITLQKHQLARKYLSKCLSLDNNFAPAHMAFGVSLALEGERGQAISAFATAARIMQGSHVPLMLLGREYYLEGAVSTSTKFFKNALANSPNNPTLLQEVGVMLFNNGEYTKAEGYFRLACNHMKAIDPGVTLTEWEPVYNNLGHVKRKLGKFEEALHMHECALQLSPKNPATLTAIAYVYLLMGELDKVMEFAHQSLRLKREDHFTLEVLHIAIEEQAEVPLSLVEVEEFRPERFMLLNHVN